MPHNVIVKTVQWMTRCEQASIRPPSLVKLVTQSKLDLSSIHVVLQSNYYDGYEKRTSAAQKILLSDYLNAADATYADLMCVEMPLPNVLASEMKVYFVDGKFHGHSAVCLVHAGRAGCIAPLHFDWDHSWVLHACVSGRKTVYLVPPDFGWLLNPILNTSAICVPRLSDIDRGEFLRRLGGAEVELTAGQALLFPSLWWHAFRYEAPSTSVSVRFGEQPELRPFAVLPRSFWLQRLVWQLFQQSGTESTQDCLCRCLAAFFERRSWIRRYYGVNSVYRTLLKGFGQNYGLQYLASERFNSEYYIARDELKELYCFNESEANIKFTEEGIEEARDYLFGKTTHIPYKWQRALAKYALLKRQGLRPRRGLITVCSSKARHVRDRRPSDAAGIQ
jgi:hypothetical protein